MKSRLIASLAVGAAVVLGTTGCNMIAPQATTIEYSPSDGVSVPDSGPLEVRNALIVADEAGETGNLIAAVVNPTEEALTLTVGVAGDAQTLRVPALEAISLGVDDDPIEITGLDALPGDTVEVSFQSGEEGGAAVSIPVLDGALPQYEDFVPED